QSRGLEFYLEANSGLYASRNFEERAQPTIQEYSQRKGNRKDMTVRKAFPDLIFDADLYRDDINKISFILEDYQDFLDAKKAFPQLQAGTWGGVGERALFGDLALGNIDKAVAVAELLTHLQIPVA